MQLSFLFLEDVALESLMPGKNHYPLQPFVDFLRYQKRYSTHTITAYENDLIHFFDHISLQFGDTPLNKVSPVYVRDWLASLKEERLTSRSVKRKISSLRSFFKYQLKTGTIESTPMTNIISPKTGKRLPVFVKESDTKEILDTLALSTEDWKSLNAQVLLTLFYSTGMRLSELINLKEKQFDKGRSQIKVLGKGNKERMIPIGKDLLVIIEDYLHKKKLEFKSTEDFLLVTEKGRKMYPKYVYLLVNKSLSMAPTLDKKSPHVLRHTFATHLMNGGADLNAVKELLGHSSLASSQVYTHNTIEKLKDVYKKAHPKA